MKKRKHHYVWRYYLKSWATNEKIYCLRNGEIFESNLIGVASKRDFYRLKEFNKNDIELIRFLVTSPKSPHLLQKLNNKFIENFSMIFELKNLIELNNLSSKEVDQELENLINNLHENMHERIEHNAIEMINLLKSKNTSFYRNDKLCLTFLVFICIQYFRTNAIKQNMINTFKNNPDIDIEKIWNIR